MDTKDVTQLVSTYLRHQGGDAPVSKIAETVMRRPRTPGGGPIDSLIFRGVVVVLSNLLCRAFSRSLL